MEAACRKAVAVCASFHRPVKHIPAAAIETDPAPETGVAGASVFLHGTEGLLAHR
ncbi:hypothetical protein ABK046_38230 [Streptomyces caeruleatus]